MGADELEGEGLGLGYGRRKGKGQQIRNVRIKKKLQKKKITKE